MLRRNVSFLFVSIIACLIADYYESRFVLAQPDVQSSNLNASQLLQQSAIAGEPFGTGHVSLFLGQYDSSTPPRVQVSDEDGHIFYPVLNLRTLPPSPRVEPPAATRPIGRGGLVERLRNAVSTARQRTIELKALEIDFLIVGSKPIRLKIADVTGSIELTIPVQSGAPNSEALMAQRFAWLEALARSAKRDIDQGDYPPVFQTFMVETMARRLGIPPIDLRVATSDEKTVDDPLAKPLSTLELLSNTERLRDQVFQETLRSPSHSESTENGAIPEPPTWIQAPVPETPESLPIESIASSVPPECLYLRFGRFANYLWFRELGAGKGAGLAQMVTVRGSNSTANLKIERMLNTKMNLMTKLFGDSIIQDMAIIGHDLYLQDGASLGVVLESNSMGQLQAAMDTERKNSAESQKSEGVQMDEIQIAGRSVTLLSNRDHSIRSFRVVDGNYLLLTTSRSLVERFLAVRDGQPSLASTPNFRYARMLLPVQNNYELFAYFSPEFFQHLMSPQYIIELRRRYSAKARIAAAEMATLMAKAEGIPHDSLQSLIQSNLLPPWIETATDGSQLVRDKDRWLDSRRGGFGAMLPISDVPMLDCTPAEAEQYRADATFYSSQWKSAEPIMVGVRRFQDTANSTVDRLAIEAYVAPWDAGKLGKWGRFLGAPVNTMIAQPVDDLVSAQAHMAGQNLLGSQSPDNVLFAGLKDNLPPVPEEDAGLLQILRYLRQTPVYIGAWPQPRYLDMLPLGLGGSNPNVDGFSRALLGLWRWQGNGFSVISFDRSILEHAIGFLEPVPAPDPAQVRFMVKDLEQTQLAGWVNTFWYRRAYAASRGNLRLLDAMQQTFQLEPEAALQEASYLLDTKLVAPYGGELTIAKWHSQAQVSFQIPSLISSSQSDPMRVDIDRLQPPAGYKADWLGWMRGLQAHLTQSPEGLILLATVDLEKLSIPGSNGNNVQLPSLDFDLFKLPSQLFGGKEKNKEPPPKEQRSF